jgi:hypothetical protein
VRRRDNQPSIMGRQTLLMNTGFSNSGAAEMAVSCFCALFLQERRVRDRRIWSALPPIPADEETSHSPIAKVRVHSCAAEGLHG